MLLMNRWSTKSEKRNWLHLLINYRVGLNGVSLLENAVLSKISLRPVRFHVRKLSRLAFCILFRRLLFYLLVFSIEMSCCCSSPPVWIELTCNSVVVTGWLMTSINAIHRLTWQSRRAMMETEIDPSWAECDGWRTTDDDDQLQRLLILPYYKLLLWDIAVDGVFVRIGQETQCNVM